MKILLILCLPFMFNACSKERHLQEKAREAVSDTAETFDEAASDVRQEACEMVDGQLECAVERAERDVQDAID